MEKIKVEQVTSVQITVLGSDGEKHILSIEDIINGRQDCNLSLHQTDDKKYRITLNIACDGYKMSSK